MENSEICKIWKNLNILESKVPPRLAIFVQTMHTLHKLDFAIAGFTIRGDYHTLLNTLKIELETLKTRFGLSETPKIHILVNHVEEYIRKTGQSLGWVSDHTVEHFHQITDQRFSSSHYHIKDLTSDLHGVKLLEGTLHLNAYQV